MPKAAMLILISLFAVACGGNPPQMSSASQSYSIIAEKPDLATSGIVVDIQLNGQPSQNEVKTIAESLIASRKDQYKNVVVRSFVEGAAQGRVPYAFSRIENGAITHQFNPQSETQKIPTH